MGATETLLREACEKYRAALEEDLRLKDSPEEVINYLKGIICVQQDTIRNNLLEMSRRNQDILKSIIDRRLTLIEERIKKSERRAVILSVLISVVLTSCLVFFGGH